MDHSYCWLCQGAANSPAEGIEDNDPSSGFIAKTPRLVKLALKARSLVWGNTPLHPYHPINPTKLQT
jgi:hypothetical protein